jgi:PAS domain S-box-containing protein
MNSAVESESDVCEFNVTEQALKTSEENFRSLFMNMSEGFAYCKMIWDENGRPEDFVYLEVNDAFEKLTGLKRTDVLGKRVTEAIPSIKEMHPELFEIYGRTASTGKEQSFETYFQPLDIWLSISVYSPKKSHFAAVFENITERKKDAERIRFQAELLNAAGQSIIGTDNDRNITYWNSGAERLHGWSEKEMKGQHISRIISEDIVHEFMPRVDGHVNVGESWSGEITTKRRDGTVIPIMVTIAPIKNDKGESIGTVSVETDISEQKWMQKVTNDAVEKVTELNEKLQVVESLTRHDIRNKLSALNSRVFLLKKRLADNPETSAHLRELELLSQQILRLLEFERVYVRVGAEELNSINVEDSVAEAASLFSSMKDVELINDCHGLTVMADSLLRQLFYNLMDNSFKYGEKLSKIRVHYVEQKNQLLLICEDDGVGIPEVMKSGLFQKGFGKGTGYGLYLMKRICEAYGWTIQETGKPCEGAQFTMTIPKIGKDGKRNYQIG